MCSGAHCKGRSIRSSECVEPSYDDCDVRLVTLQTSFKPVSEKENASLLDLAFRHVQTRSNLFVFLYASSYRIDVFSPRRKETRCVNQKRYVSVLINVCEEGIDLYQQASR